MSINFSSFLFTLLAVFILPCAPAHAAAPLTKAVMTTGSLSEREGVLYVAQDQGFFRKYGLDLTLVQVRNGPVGMSALASGESLLHWGSVSAANLGAIAEGAIPHLDHELLTVASLIEVLAQFSGQSDKLHGKILLLFQTSVVGHLVGGGALAWLLDHRCHFKAYGNGARRALLVLLIEREHQTGLKKAVAPAEIGLERGPQRISMPLGIGHMLAVAPDPGVICTDDKAREFLLGNSLLEDGIKQSPWFPLRAGEDLVVG